MAIISKIKDSDGTAHDIIDTKNTSGVYTYSGEQFLYLIGSEITNVSDTNASAATYTIDKIKAYADGTLNSRTFKTSGNQIVISDSGIVVGKDNVKINTSGITTTGTISADTSIITSGSISATGSIESQRGITAAQITSTGSISAKSTISANGGLTATTITASGVINANGGLVVNGDLTAAGFYQSSDENLKTFTEDYDINLDNLKNIKTGKFYWNADSTQEINGGVSAQTVEQYFPELVMENEDGMKSVNYDGLAVVAIAAIKKLTDRIEQLEEIVRNK